VTVEDPWGVSLTILHDPDILGLHHVQLRVPDPESALAWYLEVFGGVQGTLKGRVAGVRYGSVWLLAEPGDSKPSAGRAIDHIAWRTPDLEAKAAELVSRGVAFTITPRQFNETVRISFVQGPAGTRIELLQRA
jgi:catechol 2,3-dioxygenase-like lactoylglutathione lyase family enzyme